MVKFKVVIVRVRHANAEPPFRQNISFSGSQRVSHELSPVVGAIIFAILISLVMDQSDESVHRRYEWSSWKMNAHDFSVSNFSPIHPNEGHPDNAIHQHESA
jgi:hypothetical protein